MTPSVNFARMVSRGAVLALLVAGAAACGDPLVGAECVRGYAVRGGSCVPVDAGTDGDADGGDGGGDGLDGGMEGGPSVDASVPGCPAGYTDCEGACVRLDLDEDHCGDCDTACDPGDVCAGGSCANSCMPPREDCPAGCVDTNQDFENCGACGVVCSSGVCADAECVFPAPGHLIIVGHDFRGSNAAMRRTLGNAVFLAQGSPVDVLVYEGTAANAVKTGIVAALEEVEMLLGRSWVPTTADAEFITYLLGQVDVFLIYPQDTGTNETLQALGADWALALNEFLERGGIVVLADAPSATHDGTWQLLEAAGLFSAEGITEVSGDMLAVDVPSDAVMVGVPVTYQGRNNTVWFDTPFGTAVASHPDGPVVIHRVVVP